MTERELDASVLRWSRSTGQVDVFSMCPHGEVVLHQSFADPEARARLVHLGLREGRAIAMPEFLHAIEGFECLFIPRDEDVQWWINEGALRATASECVRCDPYRSGESVDPEVVATLMRATMQTPARFARSSSDRGHAGSGEAFLPLPEGVTAGSMALAMSDFLGSPHYTEIAAEIMSEPQWQEQANSESGRQLAEFNTRVREEWEKRHGPTAESATISPEWITQSATHALVVWLAGQARTCMHDPRPDSGQPVFATAWKPGLIVCAHCTHLQTPRGDEKYRCDFCGSVSHPRDGGGVHSASLNLGALWFEAGICSGCAADGHGEAPDEH